MGREAPTGSRARRSRADRKAVAAAICSPLGLMTEETKRTIGVTASASPSSESTVPSHTIATARARNTNAPRAEAARLSQLPAVACRAACSTTAGSRYGSGG